MQAPLTFLAACLAVTVGGSARAEDLTVFAAASLKNALDTIAADFGTRTGTTVVIAYGGSATLARQIAAGAPADIFVAAAPDWMDSLQAQGLIRAGTRTDLVGNTLVLIAAGRDAALADIRPGFDLAGLLAGGKLSMALTDSVPAGQYGRQALETLGLWDEIAPQVVQSDNVRAALALVALGAAPYGIVYGSDAVADDAAGSNVTVVGTFPTDSHATITYPAAIIATSDHPAAGDFLAALSSEGATKVFMAEGFTALP